MADMEFWDKTDFSYSIAGDDREIELQVYIDAECECSRTLVASFQVDSMEMIESARIPLVRGKNHVPFLQTVRIVKPLVWRPRGSSGQPLFYHFSVVFHEHGTPCHTIEKRAGIRFVEPRQRGKMFRINGELLPLTGYVHGGCSPIGMKKPLPTFIFESALLYDYIYVSAGVRGLQIRIAPQALIDFIAAGIYPL